MYNALTYIGWTILNGSLLYFGVLNIGPSGTERAGDTFIFPVHDFLFAGGDGGGVTVPPGPTVPPVVENVTVPVTTETTTTTPTETTTAPKATTTTPVVTTTTPGAIKTTTTPNASEYIIGVKPEYSECGIRTSGRAQLIGEKRHLDPYDHQRLLIDLRIVGGRDTVDGEWPWVAHIFEKPAGLVDGGICAGTLISERWIVSAAHCFITQNPDIYGVVVGEHRKSELSGYERISDVKRIVIHPKYNTMTLNNDIALVELSKPVELNEFIRPSCLVEPDVDYRYGSPYLSRICTTLGWGTVDPYDELREQSDVLQQLNLMIIIQDACVSIIQEYQQDYAQGHVDLDGPKFCAGASSGEDTCDGDSGGPLICKHDDGKFYLHGITSYGTTTCAQEAKPGIFTKVSAHVGWIYATIEEPNNS